MRLLMIASEFPPGPGGIANHAHQLLLNLNRLGWDLAVVCPQDYAGRDETEAFNCKQPFQVVSVPSGRGRFFEAFHRLRLSYHFCRKFQPDVVVGTGLSGVWVAAALATLRRLPCLAVAHGSEFGATRWLSLTLNRLAFERMGVVVAVSQFTRRVMESSGIRPERVEVIPNAADHRRFRLLPESECQAFRTAVGFGGGGSLLLTVGHVSERKGQEIVIRSLPEILKKVPNTHYVMVGLPTLKEPLTRLAMELGVENHIHFVGPVSNHDMLHWLNCVDVFVMTSRTTSTGDCEGFGIAVVEAALCGKPAVVSAQSGLIEAIQENVTGLAVRENDVAATALAIGSLLSNAGLRAEMGAAALSRAERDQTWETSAPRYDAILRQLAHSCTGRD